MFFQLLLWKNNYNSVKQMHEGGFYSLVNSLVQLLKKDFYFI